MTPHLISKRVSLEILGLMHTQTFSTMTKETEYQLALLEEMIERRIINTGESREEACIYISKYLLGQFTND